MTSACPPPLWCDPMPLLLLGTGTALPGEPISSEELLAAVDRRFHLSLRRRGMAIAHKLGIRTRHLCRDMAVRLEIPRKGHRNPGLAAAALRGALTEAVPTARDLSYLIGHTATPARLMPPNISQVAELLAYDGPFVEFRQACTGFANALVFAQGLLPAGAGPIAIVGSETGSVFFDPHRAAEIGGQPRTLFRMGEDGETRNGRRLGYPGGKEGDPQTGPDCGRSRCRGHRLHVRWIPLPAWLNPAGDARRSQPCRLVSGSPLWPSKTFQNGTGEGAQLSS